MAPALLIVHWKELFLPQSTAKPDYVRFEGESSNWTCLEGPLGFLLHSSWGEYEDVTDCSFPVMGLKLSIPLREVKQKARRLAGSPGQLNSRLFLHKERNMSWSMLIL